MMGRLAEVVGEAWPSAAWASEIAECVPTPAATAPSTDVLTKSRRENVMILLETMVLQAKAEAYHGLEQRLTPGGLLLQFRGPVLRLGKAERKSVNHE